MIDRYELSVDGQPSVDVMAPPPRAGELVDYDGKLYTVVQVVHFVQPWDDPEGNPSVRVHVSRSVV